MENIMDKLYDLGAILFIPAILITLSIIYNILVF